MRLVQFLALHAAGFAAAEALGGFRVADGQGQAQGQHGGHKSEGFHDSLPTLGMKWREDNVDPPTKKQSKANCSFEKTGNSTPAPVANPAIFSTPAKPVFGFNDLAHGTALA
ncbi:MAG: hypothetical protein LWW84_01795 [Azovibrio sp.]|nr:hypothetical protein [Azovibrio sp.]